MKDDMKKQLLQIKKEMKGKSGDIKNKGVSKKQGAHAFETVDPKDMLHIAQSSGGLKGGKDKSRDMSELPPEPEPGEGKTFNIGIDVGTSMMKVCARPPGNSTKVHVIILGNKKTALCPSTVVIEGGRLYFGAEAEKRVHLPDTRIFRQLKVCLACESGVEHAVPTSGCLSERDEKTKSCTAIFEVTNKGESAYASDLLTLFLAWAMGESRRQLPDELTGGRLTRCTYSISAPVDQIDAGSDLNDAYARVVFHSWRLSAAVQQGITLKKALSWITAIENIPLPPEEDRMVELCAESGAIVAGYTMSPEIEEGLYAVVDIGAWTSEMSIFRFSESGKQTTGLPERSFYAARSYRVAGNQVDERCRSHLIQLYDCSDPHEDADTWHIQQQRESGQFGKKEFHLSARHKQIRPRESALRFAQDMVAEELGRCFIKTLHEAYEKEKVEKHWKGLLRVILAGGGSIDPIMYSAIKSTFIRNIQEVPEPGDLVGLPAKGDYRRFLVAYGLAHGSIRWPRDYFPSAVLPFRLKQRKRRTSEEIGYSGR